MVATREELECRIAAQDHVIEYALCAVGVAKLFLERNTAAKLVETTEFKQLIAMLTALAREGEIMGGSKLAVYAHRQGMLEAARLGEEVLSRGNDEWKAGAQTVINLVRAKAGYDPDIDEWRKEIANAQARRPDDSVR